MAFKFLKLKRNKLGLEILAAFVTVFLVLAFLINLYWSPILAQKIRDAVLNGSDSLYKANFSKAELHILHGNIIFYNIQSFTKVSGHAPGFNNFYGYVLGRYLM